MINRNLKLIEEKGSINTLRFVNEMTKLPVGIIYKTRDEKGILWQVEAFDDFNGKTKGFRSLEAARYYLCAFAVEAWEEEVAEMRFAS